ncbi:MAG: hypothetical protein ACK5NT_10910 [Pyrinomonadaceae bacterium]
MIVNIRTFYILYCLSLIVTIDFRIYGFGFLNQNNIKPIRVYKNFQIEDISNDGRLLLMYNTSSRGWRTTIPFEGIGNVKDDEHDNTSLKILDSRSGTIVSTTPRELGTGFGSSNFIPNSDLIYIRGIPVDESKYIDGVWDPNVNQIRKCFQYRTDEYQNTVFVDRSMVIGSHTMKSEKYSKERYKLFKMNLPECVPEIDGNAIPDEVEGGDVNMIFRGIRISPSRDKFVYSNYKYVIERDVRSFNLENMIDLTKSSSETINVINYTADGKYLILEYKWQRPDHSKVSGSSFTYSVGINDAHSFIEVRRFQVEGGNNAGVSPDGKYLAIGSKKITKGIIGDTEKAVVTFYEVKTGEKVNEIGLKKGKEIRGDPFQADLRKIIFSPDGRFLYTATRDTYVWDFEEIRNPDTKEVNIK